MSANTPYGTLRATTNVCVVDIFGQSVTRRVNIGRRYSASLEESQKAVNKARENNPGMEIRAEFKVDL